MLPSLLPHRWVIAVRGTELPGDECVGAAGWLRTTEGHVGSAGALLADVEGIDERDPQAPERLHDLAMQFSLMATEVRSRPTPVVAVEANTHLANAFDAYAEAFNLAAAGVGAAEDEALAQAIARLEEARTAYTGAVGLAADAAFACGLDTSALAPV